MANNTLSVQELRYCYPEYPGLGKTSLFAGCSLELQEGQFGVLLGVPASGKSTLAGILTRLVPRFTGGDLSGRLILAGRSLAGLRPGDLLRDAGLVFQNSADQILTTRCDLEVAFGLESLGLSRGEMRAKVERALGWMDLAEYRERDPHTLSGGEKKKLLLACLQALDPGLWILDETLEEIDAATRRRLMRHLRDEGRTVLFLASRWNDLYAEHGDRFFLLREGRIETAAAPLAESFMEQIRADGMTFDAVAGGPAGVPGEPLLRAEGLRFRYSGERGFDLRVDSLEVRRGETLALVGRNGSGKSTLSRLLCGLLTAEAGRVLVRDGRGGLRPVGAEALKSFTGYMFQNPDYQIFLPTVREELSYGLARGGPGREDIRRRVERVIELFRLPSAEAPPALMSYGQRKRLQAATYALLERPLLILDEGDSGLSYRDFADLVHLLRAADRSLVIITHDARLAGRLAHRTVQLERGRVVS